MKTLAGHYRCDLHPLRWLYLRHHDEEEVVHLWTMGFGSSYCISLLFFIVLAPYELHNMIMAIFVSLLSWIFLWVNIWDCNCSLIFSVWVDAYYVPISCLLVMIKHVYESMCGETCVLVGVTGGDYSGEDSPWVSLECLPYFVTSLGIKKIPRYRVSLAWPCWVSTTWSSIFLF
jgi:hypothetical protein